MGMQILRVIIRREDPCLDTVSNLEELYVSGHPRNKRGLSTREAEYRAIVTAAKEIRWLKRLVEECGWNSNYSVLQSSDT